MQRSSSPAIISTFNAPQDKNLWMIKESISQAYWSSDEGVFEFQFISDNIPLTNITAPYYFQLIRYTPDFLHDSYQTVIQGRLNSDGTIEYGGGRLGLYGNGMIQWNNGGVWNKVNYVPRANNDILDLRIIRDQAYLDSAVVMGGVYNQKYLY